MSESPPPPSSSVIPFVRPLALPSDPRGLSLPDIWREWWSRIGNQCGYSNKKKHRQAEALSRTLPDFPDPLHIERWVTDLLETRRLSGELRFSPRTVDEYRYCVGNLYGWAQARGLSPVNPVAASRRIPPPPADTHPIRNIDEVWPGILAVCKSQTERALCGVYRYCGLRREEGIALFPEDINLEVGELHVNRQRPNPDRWTTAAPKGRHESGRRILPLAPELAELLQPLLKNPAPIQTVLLRTRRRVELTGGERFLFPLRFYDMQGLRERLGKAFPEHFGPLHAFHTFRHTCSFELWTKAKVEIEVLSEFLGHESIMATQTYISRLVGGRVRESSALTGFLAKRAARSRERAAPTAWSRPAEPGHDLGDGEGD